MAVKQRFLVSFMVDARGGAMRGCRHSGVRVIIPPRKAAMPMRITCRYLKKDKLVHAPPLMEGEALGSRILEMGPSSAKFLGPVIIEVPHFASLRGKEREIVILRSDNGETWREHTLEATEEAVQEVLNESFDGEDLKQLEDLNTTRITRILTTDFPQYFAIVTRIRQEVHAIGPDGGMVSSTVVPQVQAVFPQGALTKKIKVGLQAQPISPELVAKLLGNRVAVSPIVTVEPRRRKFHKPITLTIPVPQAASKGMINQYSGEAPTLRLLCSITGGTTRAQWEDVTGSTPLTFVNDCVSFTTTVSARFWLMDCTNIPEATKMATELYREAIHVPFMSKFVVFSKRHQVEEARVRVFCMTDDKEDKTLETQEQFIEVAKSRDVEVLEGKTQYLEFGGNLVPVTKSGEQLAFNFYAFRENRLPFTVRVKDINAESVGRVAFMRQPKVGRGDPPQNPICNLNLVLPENVQPELAPSEPDLLSLERKYAFLSISKADTIHKADLRLSDISNMLSSDWVALAKELGQTESDINIIKSQYPDNVPQQAIVMLRLWMQTAGNKATGNTLEKSLRKIHRDDIVDTCIFNVELVTDDRERAVAKTELDVVSGFESRQKDVGPTKDTTIKRDASMEVSYDEKDLMKEAERAEEDGSKKDLKDSRKDADMSPTYEREEKKYAGEEKVFSVEEKFIREERSAKIEEKIQEQKIHKEETFSKDGSVFKEKMVKKEEKVSKEDTLSQEEKFTSETRSKEGKSGEVIIEKMDTFKQDSKEKSTEVKKEKSVERTVTEGGQTKVQHTKIDEKSFEKSAETNISESSFSHHRTIDTQDIATPKDKPTHEEVSEVITAERKVSPVVSGSESSQVPKAELLQKLGEELGRLDERLEEKFKDRQRAKDKPEDRFTQPSGVHQTEKGPTPCPPQESRGLTEVLRVQEASLQQKHVPAQAVQWEHPSAGPSSSFETPIASGSFEQQNKLTSDKPLSKYNNKNKQLYNKHFKDITSMLIKSEALNKNKQVTNRSKIPTARTNVETSTIHTHRPTSPEITSTIIDSRQNSGEIDSRNLAATTLFLEGHEHVTSPQTEGEDRATVAPSHMERNRSGAFLKSKVEKHPFTSHQFKEAKFEKKTNSSLVPQSSKDKVNLNNRSSIEKEMKDVTAEFKGDTNKIKMNDKKICKSDTAVQTLLKDFLINEEETINRLPTIAETGKEIDEDLSPPEFLVDEVAHPRTIMHLPELVITAQRKQKFHNPNLLSKKSLQRRSILKKIREKYCNAGRNLEMPILETLSDTAPLDNDGKENKVELNIIDSGHSVAEPSPAPECDTLVEPSNPPQCEIVSEPNLTPLIDIINSPVLDMNINEMTSINLGTLPTMSLLLHKPGNSIYPMTKPVDDANYDSRILNNVCEEIFSMITKIENCIRLKCCKELNITEMVVKLDELKLNALQVAQ